MKYKKNPKNCFFHFNIQNFLISGYFYLKTKLGSFETIFFKIKKYNGGYSKKRYLFEHMNGYFSKKTVTLIIDYA